MAATLVLPPTSASLLDSEDFLSVDDDAVFDGAFGREADWRGFNSLPPLSESKRAIESVALLELLTGATKRKSAAAEEDTLASVCSAMFEHDAEEALCVVLTHMHYPLAEGESQVTALDSEVRDGVDTAKIAALDIELEAHMAKPRKAADFDDRIPFKWCLAAGADEFIAYEFYASTVPNAEYYREEARKFVANKALQRALAKAIRATGLGKYLGIGLRYCASEASFSTAYELNDVSEKESRFLIMHGEKDDITAAADALELSEATLTTVKTGWAFERKESASKDGELVEGVACFVCSCICPDE